MSVTASPPTCTEALPLCVDLDGTLVRSDTLVEGMLSILGRRALLSALLRLPQDGRAVFKQRISELSPPDPAFLPYDAALLAYLRRQKSAGRMLVLATAADRRVADAVARHLALFDEVIASDGIRNAKGRTKAGLLCRRFGRGNFVYAGDTRGDLPVWRDAAAAVLAGRSSHLAGEVRQMLPVEADFTAYNSPIPALRQALRMHQWVKNLLVFIPICTAHVIDQPRAWAAACMMFAAFCAMASAIYIVNDLTDLAADRRHPRKRSRPFASGALDARLGLLAVGVLAPLGLALAACNGTVPILLLYAAMSVGYSVKLKEEPLVDVFLLAGLYTIRLFGGGAAIGHALSLWLLGFASFLFLSLALLKRVEELASTATTTATRFVPRRGYMPADLSTLFHFGCSSAFASSVVLALFVQREATAEFYALPGLLWGIVPLMLFWQCRLWLSTSRGYMHDDPIVYASRDWVSWVVGGCAIGLLVLAKSDPLGLL
jgi:4-hydroxybenzoate polyprenyltransferase